MYHDFQTRALLSFLCRYATIQLLDELPLGEFCVRKEFSIMDHTYQRPLQLPKHNREWEKFGRTFYTKEHFTEPIDFDKLEVELLTPDGEKKHSGPRTPLMDA